VGAGGKSGAASPPADLSLAVKRFAASDKLSGGMGRVPGALGGGGAATALLDDVHRAGGIRDAARE